MLLGLLGVQVGATTLRCCVYFASYRYLQLRVLTSTPCHQYECTIPKRARSTSTATVSDDALPPAACQTSRLQHTASKPAVARR